MIDLLSNLYIWETAEISATIIATTIPVLRVLVQRVKTHYSNGNTTNLVHESSAMGGIGTRSTQGMGRRGTLHSHDTDTTSDKGILRGDDIEDVDLSSQDGRKEAREGVYEMQPRMKSHQYHV
jgi:hypothetical protein